MNLKLVKSKTKEPMSIEKAFAIIDKAIRYHLHCGYGDDESCSEHNRDRDAWNFLKLYFSYQVNQKEFTKYLKSTDEDDGIDFK
tara:strand:+ start:394 stop:645 length:252 start_codon:yes stop_codon:yes gene_type:complete